MHEKLLGKLFEHNNWANLRIIEACSALSDELLDAEPLSATRGSIRVTLIHLIASQQGYVSLLTQPVEKRLDSSPAFADLAEVASKSGEELIALVRNPNNLTTNQLQTRDGYSVEPWVVMVQAINHAAEHREQISSMLSALGETPLDLDGWTYGEVTEALIPIST